MMMSYIRYSDTATYGIPITQLSNDPYDLEPLTPNHLLLLKENQLCHLECLDITINMGRDDGGSLSILQIFFCTPRETKKGI